MNGCASSGADFGNPHVRLAIIAVSFWIPTCTSHAPLTCIVACGYYIYQLMLGMDAIEESYLPDRHLVVNVLFVHAHKIKNINVIAFLT